MKKLIGLFLWTCAATILAQGCILTLSYLRGNLNKNTFVEVIAMLNGIDIPGERLRKAVESGKEVPTPSFEEIALERAKLSLELDSRESSLNRQKDVVEARIAELQDRERRFDQRRNEFFASLEELRNGTLDEGLGEVRRYIESMTPEQAKSAILDMKKKGNKRDLVTIVKGLSDEKRKKIAGEFTKEEEPELFEILAELRKGDPVASLINDAQGQQGSAP